MKETTKSTKSKTPKMRKGPSIAHGVGRRKSSVARAWLKRGSGIVFVNGKPVDTYFDTDTNKTTAIKAFTILENSKNYDAHVNVYGGGVSSQAGAVRLGISRALLAADETVRPTLRKHGLLTVDARNVERKKYGQKGARAKFQFVKR